MKKMKRILSAAMVLLLMATLPITAFAEEYNIDEGSITVFADSTGQYVTQVGGVQNYQQTTETVITQTDSSTSTATTNTITINATGTDVTAEVTIKDVDIFEFEDGGAVTINAADGAEANVTLDGVDITAREAAISTEGEGNVTIELDNSNELQSGYGRAGLEKNNTGTLTITDTDNNGSLDARGGEYGAGIGGAAGEGGSNIIITGGTVTATGGTTAAGIGGGGCGIAGGGGNASNISIWGDTQLKVQGGVEHIYNGKTDIYAGAAIGHGGGYWSSEFSEELDHHGTEVTPNTDELTKDGKIEYYAPGADMSSSTPTKTVTGTHEHTWNSGEITKEATCAETGVMTYTCTAGNGFTKTEEIAATGKHNIVIDPAVAATCTSTGLTAGQHCTTCATQTVEQQEVAKLEHNIVIDPAVAPTYTSTGLTEGSHCTTCDTMTVKQEIVPMLERPTETESDDTQSAPLYRVMDKDGKNISYKAEQKDGVLTITVDADFAILTGTLSGINTLKARGTEKIVFVTKGAKSTFAPTDLLEKGSLGEIYKLTHDGKTVTFTLGTKNTDVSGILEKA